MTDVNETVLEDFDFATSNADHGDKTVAALVILDWGAQFIRDDGFVGSLMSTARKRKLSDKQAYWVRKKAESRHIPYAVVADASNRLAVYG